MKKSIWYGVIALFLLLTACNRSPQETTCYSSTCNHYVDAASGYTVTQKDGFALGTYINIKLYDSKKVDDEILAEGFRLFYEYEQMISAHRPDSDIDQINQSAGLSGVIVSEEVAHLITQSQHYYEQSEGLFDISIGALVTLWNIGSDEAAVPSFDLIDDALEKVDFRKVQWNEENREIFLPHKGMQIDMGGIAKGYIADQVKAYFMDHGISHGILNVGGNVIVIGEKPHVGPWRIGIRDPQGTPSDTICGVTITDCSVVSSGVYERFFEQDGVRYHHILNPFTGFPEDNELLSTTIISKYSIDGDALSTSTFLLGLNRSSQLIDSLSDVEAIFVTKDHQIFVTHGLASQVFQVDDRYRLTILNQPVDIP